MRKNCWSSWVVLLLDVFAPAAQQAVGDTELVADTTDDEIDSVLQRAWPRVERRHRGQDNCPGLGAGRQVAQLNQVKGRLARHQDQLAPLLEVNVGGSVD